MKAVMSDTTLHSTKNENPKESTLVIKEEDKCTSLHAVAITTAQLSQAFSTSPCRTAANNNKMAASREVVERELFGQRVLALDNNCHSFLPRLSARRERTPPQNKLNKIKIKTLWHRDTFCILKRVVGVYWALSQTHSIQF